jgi:hypothetical protein
MTPMSVDRVSKTTNDPSPRRGHFISLYTYDSGTLSSPVSLTFR